ncbi:ThiF family adenylyltransferase [Curvibacter sp. RS43]|uniref:ThiF family adenylyltransferase n=1 Tax=Curvibacter microcysteis TaxID=3026419 RepID=UPI00235E366B|nr:ThiF family adenylyltransferase [Curvibacter sp. RS43]MDD0810040.1 ThiF family adenylyltransferase [Curvibacter sp. RS43]
MLPVKTPYLRDGIDVYVRGTEEVHFVFLATRTRIVLRIRSCLINALVWLDGTSDCDILVSRMVNMHGKQAGEQFEKLLRYLEQKGIVVQPDWLEQSGLDKLTVATQQRQLSFFLDLLGTPDQAIAVQRKILEARIICFGLGAVGGWLVRQLLGLGFRQFVLVDHDAVSESDVTRHAFFDATDAVKNINKAEAAATKIREQFQDADIAINTAALTTQTQLDEVIPTDISIVINTADQPYIGYTSVVLSRFCVSRRLPLFVAGGFDAHLGSLGEMIIPGITPCADCYAEHFSEALKDWVPVVHPVDDRRQASGGLCSMAVFSAGAAAMQILRLFTNEGTTVGGRGEMLFERYRLDTFTVERRPDCLICSNI